jgi:hypothetical protein
VNRIARPALILALLVATASAQAAEPPPPLGWYFNGGLSYVLAGGNSRASSFGVKADVKRLWTRSTLTLGAASIRASSSDPGRIAVGTPDDFEEEAGPKVLKAEKYAANGGFDRQISDRFGWQVGSEFLRDRFAGLDSRILGAAGVRYLFANRKDFVFKTGLAATIAHQSDVVDDPTVDDTFAGLRVIADLERRFGGASSYVGGLAVDENLNDTDDLRVRFANTLGVSMARKLALQVGLLLLYDHQPSLVDVPLFAPDGAATGLTLPVRAATLDTTFTVSFVVTLSPPAPTP